MAKASDTNVLFSIEVRWKNHLRLWVEPECLDMRVPPGTIIEVRRKEPSSPSPAIWMDDIRGSEQALILFPEWGNEVLVNGVDVYDCWRNYIQK